MSSKRQRQVRGCAGFAGTQRFKYFHDAFDVRCGEALSATNMLSVGRDRRSVTRLEHPRTLDRCLDRAQSESNIWICGMRDIALHWREHDGSQVESKRL